MKKILSIAFCLCLLLSLFTFCVGATASGELPLMEKGKKVDVFYSDDYSRLSLNQNTYISIDDASVEFIYYNENEDDFYEENLEDDYIYADLTDEQKKTVSELQISANDTGDFLEVTYTLASKAEVYVSYINEKYSSAYEKALKGEADKLRVDFGYPEENYVTADFETLKQNKQEKEFSDLLLEEAFPVYIDIAPGSIEFAAGTLIIYNGEYYYSDYKETDMAYYNFSDSIIKEEKITVYKIEDPKLLSALEDGYDKFYDDISLFNEDLGKTVSLILSVLVFGIIPLAVMIVFGIFGLRSKTKYKKYFLTVSGIALAELIVFAVIFVTMVIK